MKPYTPDKIFVEKSVAKSPITRNVLSRSDGCRVEQIDSTEEKLKEARTWNPAPAKAKKSLILAKGKGSLVKPCPGQQSRGNSRNVCCDYFVINFASNCHMECTYCYLQSYLNFPYLLVYANIEKIYGELELLLDSTPNRIFRIGTGELADSLALDPLTRYSRYLVEFFAERKNALLELKTKSDHVDNLLNLDHRGRTVVAWSLNPDYIQRNEEWKTASISRRISAARRCFDAGYPLAFHFDPIIHYPGWEEGYRDVLEQLFSQIPGASICWISLGGLRMNPALMDIIRTRFPGSILPHGEFIPADDGKLRYFKPIRVEMYRKLRALIRRVDSRIPVYACMERPEVWDRAFGGRPVSNRELNDRLTQIR